MKIDIGSFFNGKSLLRNRHFWIIGAIMLVLILFYNASYFHITGWLSWFKDIINAPGIYAFIFSFLFLVPILYASVVFRIKGALITWLIFLVSVLPRATYESTSFEYLLIVALFSVVALLAGVIMALDYNPPSREGYVSPETTTRWNYLARRLRMREYERQYIARKLHDNIIQSLLVIANRARALEVGDYGEVSQDAKKSLGKLQTMVLHVMDDVRRLSRGLRLSVLDNVGLLPVLKWQVERITQENGILVDIKVNGMEYMLPSEHEMAIYQIIKEALNNITQHSRATRAIVTLDFVTPDFQATIEDNGQGFKVAPELNESDYAASSGIGRMWQQAKLVGGTLSIKSENGKGTTVSVTVKL